MASRDAESLRRTLLDDPNTRKIAETLGLPVEEYVQHVIEFATNPGSEPEFVAIPDAELKKMGAPTPPSIQEMTSHVKESLKVLESRTQSSFEPGKKKS